MGSPLEVSNIEVIFSVQGDPVWATLPPGTPSVRFEQNFVEGIMPFTFSESKIVVKSLFSILDFLKKNKSPHFFAPPLRKLRGGAKKWGLLFFNTFHHENILVYHNFVVFSNEYRREVLYLGLESIELGPIRTKYLN